MFEYFRRKIHVGMKMRNLNAFLLFMMLYLLLPVKHLEVTQKTAHMYFQLQPLTLTYQMQIFPGSSPLNPTIGSRINDKPIP